MHIKIFREIDPPHRIGNHAKRGCGDHHGHDGQAIQTIGQVDGIGAAHNHNHGKGDKDIAQIDQHIFEHRHGQLQRQIIRVQS